MTDRSGKHWTEEEIEYLETYIGSLSMSAIAQKLGRTPEAVLSKAEKLGISNTKIACGMLTVRQLAKCLCIDDKAVKRMIINHGLPAKQRDFRIRRVKNGRNGAVNVKQLSYYINPKKFWKWAEEHKHLINWHNVPQYSLPFEPDWLDERRKEDFYRWANKRKPWTTEQDDQLWRLYYQENMPQKKIAEIMGRTSTGIEKRLKRLRDKRLQTIS
jgi:hypothetical protein